MVVHQAPGEAFYLGLGAAAFEQAQVQLAVGCGEEHRQAPVAALGYVVRHAGQDDAGEACHTLVIWRAAWLVN